MIGKSLVRKAVAASVAAAAAFVAVIALGATLFFALDLVLPALGAAAITTAVFALVAIGVAALFLGRTDAFDEEEDEEPEGLGARAYNLFRQRPVLGAVAALAGGFIFLRNPALATMVAAAFTEKSHAQHRSRRRR